MIIPKLIFSGLAALALSCAAATVKEPAFKAHRDSPGYLIQEEALPTLNKIVSYWYCGNTVCTSAADRRPDLFAYTCTFVDNGDKKITPEEAKAALQRVELDYQKREMSVY